MRGNSDQENPGVTIGYETPSGSGGALTQSFRKLDPQKVVKLKQQGLSNSQIAQRLGVTQGAIYHVLRKSGLSTKQTLKDYS